MRARISAMVVVFGLALLATSALGAGTNLLPNGSFEGSGSGSLTGWKGQSASLALVPGDGGGFAAQVTRTANASYAIVTATKPVRSAAAGTTFTAAGRFMAPAGKSICLKLKETGASSTSAMSCAAGTGAWATIPEVSYTVHTTGDGVNFLVLQQHAAAGNRFAVDNLSVAQGGGAIQPPASLHAAARSSTEIDLGWTASSGAVGYHVYRDGATTPTATVDAPDTTYADTGLDPSSTHTYTVTAFDASQESGPSNQAGATTPADDASVSIAAAGDIACHPADPNYNGGAGQNGFCQQGATADLIAQGSYDHVLALGDEQYDCGSLAAFNTSYDASWGRFVGKTLPVPGNHEAKTTSDFGETGCSKNQTGYFTYFANHGVDIASGVNGKGYYSLDLGSWHLVAINSNCPSIGGCGAGSPQETWLKADLAAHPNQCTLAFWHEAAWSTTGKTHGVTDMRPIWTDLANGGADLVLAGHFHHYERFADLNAAGQPVPDGTGMREIVQGTGGENQGPFGNAKPIPGSQVRTSGYGALALTLASGGYSWQYLQVGGAVADSGSDTCH
jgi:hypothetical protein